MNPRIVGNFWYWIARDVWPNQQRREVALVIAASIAIGLILGVVVTS